MLLTAASTAYGSIRLKDLTVRVALQDNGDAHITEVRQMEVDDTGSECYIVIDHLNGMEVRDLAVSDETGHDYQVVAAWCSSSSRADKAGQAGLVTKSNGYEICWGIGTSGERTYTVSYTLTGLIRSWDDHDGFNHMFVARNLSPTAEYAQVIITKNGGFNENEVAMWAFGFNGDVNLRDSSVVAEASGGLDSENGMIVMLQFPKGVFHPTIQKSGSFEAVKEEAFKGSDYGQRSLTDWAKEIASWTIGIALILLVPFLMLWNTIQTWRFRRAVNHNLTWYRDLPYQGNLQRANQILDFCRYRGRNTKNYISSCVLRLVSVGALRVQPRLDGSGKSDIAIGDLQRVRGLADTHQLRLLYDIFRQAAGDDGILQPKELKKWMRRHREELVAFMSEATRQKTFKECRQELDEARKVLGLKQFLKDFTLANERHANEVALWKDYLVYAELFGIAKQVRRDMQRLNPDYLKMDDIFATLFRDDRELRNLVVIATRIIVKDGSPNSRDSGGGGSSSVGGGGGHTGGGSGGGIR